MTDPLFSIVTITYNNHDGLVKTANSIMEQKNSDQKSTYEWIIIDGGSTDQTQQYLHDLSPYATIISEIDNGIYDAMNKGLSRATGRYICFMNAGDTFPDSTILNALTHHAAYDQYDFIYGDSLEQSASDPQKNYYKRAKNYKNIQYGMFTHHQSMWYRTSILQEIKYNTAYIISADYDATYRFLNNTKKSYYLPIALSIFESGGISQQQTNVARSEQYNIRRNMKVHPVLNKAIFYRQAMAQYIRDLAPNFYWWLKKA